MAGETTMTLVGNLTADPELRFTNSGTPVASFTVASTPRTFNRNSGQWEDGNALFLRCSLWRDAAENACESLAKGMRVIVTGRLEQHSFTDRNGADRSVMQMQVDEIGPSLRYAKARVERVSRSQGQHAQQGQSFGQQQPPAQAQSGASDGWGAPNPPGVPDGPVSTDYGAMWGSEGANAEPPF